MRKLLFVGLVCGWSLPAMAFLTLPIAEDAPTRRHSFQVTGSATTESDVNLYGGRLTYGIFEGFSIFGGVGQQDLSDNIYAQGGVQYTLPIELSFDLALRGAWGWTELDAYQSSNFSLQKPVIWTYSLGLLGSSDLSGMNLEKLTAYAFVGISYQKYEIDYWSAYDADADFQTVSSETETELAIAVGALYRFNKYISAFAEIAHIDNIYLSAGASLGF